MYTGVPGARFAIVSARSKLLYGFRSTFHLKSTLNPRFILYISVQPPLFTYSVRSDTAENNSTIVLLKGPTILDLWTRFLDMNSFRHSALEVVSLGDEYEFWSRVAQDSAESRLRKELAFQVLQEFEPMIIQFEKLESLDIDEMMELVELTQDFLDALWGVCRESDDEKGLVAAYSKQGMTYLLTVVGKAFFDALQKMICKVDVWLDPLQKVQTRITEGLRLGKKWGQVNLELTGLTWISSREHKWVGDPYKDELMATFTNRLQEILKIRLVHARLSKIFSEEEVTSFTGRNCFGSLDACDCSGAGQRAWKAALYEYEKTMQPIEAKTAVTLREVFHSSLLPSLKAAVEKTDDEDHACRARPHQLMGETRKYLELFGSPLVAKSLHHEWEIMLILLQNVVGSLFWLLLHESKVEETRSTVLALLPMLKLASLTENGSEYALKELRKLQEDLTLHKQEKLQFWEADVLEKLNRIKSNSCGKLLRFDPSDGHVEVTFCDDFVALIRETRELAALGFHLNADLLKAVEAAQIFQKQGMLLKQVANFYNEISTLMIPCQKLIMLQDALRFESILKNPCDTLGRPLLWNNISAVQSYTARLQEISRSISQKNRQLQKQHSKLLQIVKRLFTLDLQNHHEQWRSCVREMTDVFDEAERQGFGNLHEWRRHWDAQLCKALEYRYNLGLKRFTSNLPEVKVQVRLRQRNLQYEPPFEEIRANHYKEIKKYLSLPMSIRGVSKQSDLFQHMIMDPSSFDGMKALYESTEELLANLLEEQKKLADTLLLGTVDLEEFVNFQVKDVKESELNFKVLKSRSKELEAFPTEIRDTCTKSRPLGVADDGPNGIDWALKVGCYKLMTEPAKVLLDEQLRRLHKFLCDSLKRKAMQSMSVIENFLAKGHKILEGGIQSVEDLVSMQQSVSELIASTPEMLEVRHSYDEELGLLRQVTEYPSSTSSRIYNSTSSGAENLNFATNNNNWDLFITKLTHHEEYLSKKGDRMKLNLEEELQELGNRLEDFETCWKEWRAKKVWKGNLADTLGSIKGKENKLKEIEGLIENATEKTKKLQMDNIDFPILSHIKQEIESENRRWETYGKFVEEIKKFRGEDWKTARTHLASLEEFLLQWETLLNTMSSKSEVEIKSLQELELYKKCLTMFPYITGEGWDHHHWHKLLGLLQLEVAGSGNLRVEDLKVGSFLDRADRLLLHADAIKALNANAAGEASIKEALHQIALWGLQRLFSLVPCDLTKKGSKTVFVIRDWQELQIEVGDQQLLLRSMGDSPYSTSFKDDLLIWERRLAALQQSLQHLNCVQRKWIYLEPIFAKGALPLEQPRFSKVDEEFRTIMGSITINPAVTSLMEIPKLEESLLQMDSQLDICQQALFAFLEEKRSSFPRFYFVGDDDLLEILGQSGNPAVIQTHLGKIFSGVKAVAFSEEGRRISAVESPEGEVLKLISSIPVLEEVEAWLNSLHSRLKLTLHENLQDSLRGSKDNIQYPCQVLCLAGQIKFTGRCEEALQSGKLSSLQENLRLKLKSIAESGGVDRTFNRTSGKAFVLDLIHAIDVVNQLVQENASESTGWTWSRQLRYYYTETGSAVVRMVGAEFQYSFEYLGILSRLVYTPLSDACYLVLSQGLRLGYGGSISGPAGTGKTESVKALGHYLGRKVLVFNCDGDFDFKSMGRIFSGVLRSGAWGCFDEFNRLEEDVLSAVSQQIQVIQVALRDKVETIKFLGKVVKVDHDAAIFVTMNPRSNKYTGRSKLPDNLKSLFRSVTMTYPDSAIIAEVNLISEGFRAAKDIGQKLIVVFSYAQEVLSPQHHYDWGLRAVKVVLTMGGHLLGEEMMNNTTVSPDVEKRLIVHALLVTTLPKLITSDCARFEQLVTDVFEDVDKNNFVDRNLEKVITDVLKAMKFQVLESQVQKVMQLHLACNQRVGVSLVGPSGTGKTTVWRVLQAALASSDQTVKVYILNPKALSRHQLLGHMDLDTQMWFDGVLTCLARKVARESAQQKCWIVCDGDVDPEWIEALNSVLDDNRVLTLPSGERIQFGSNVNILFECEHLNFASPATVSRTSMIIFCSDLITSSVLAANWLSSLGEDMKADGKIWVGEYLDKALDWVTSHECAVGISKVSVWRNVLSHLDGVKSKNEFFRGLTLGLGALMELAVRTQFHTALRDWFGYSVKTISWADLPGHPRYDLKRASSDETSCLSMIPVDSLAQTASFIWMWIAKSEPFILAGPEQCGKNTLLTYCFSKLKSTTVLTIHCSAQTSVDDIVERLSELCNTSLVAEGSKLFVPKDGKNLILFLSGINLVQLDRFKSNQLICFLQQIISYNGFYDKQLDFVRLERIQVVAALCLPTSNVGRYELPMRFTSLVRLAYMSYPPRTELKVIYKTMLLKVLRETIPNDTAWNHESAVEELTGKLLHVYEELKFFKLENCESRNKFSPHHLSTWIQGVRRYKLKEVGLLDAILHEAVCVFRDQLRTSEEVHVFEKIMAAEFKLQMDACHYGRIFTTLSPVEKRECTFQNERRKLLTSMEINDFHEIIAQSLAIYQRDVKKLPIILFPEFLQRMSKMDRVLSSPGGTLLLLGSQGVGRRSCLSVVAFMHSMELFSPSVSRSYNLRSFRMDTKSVVQTAGIEGRPVVFFLEDYQLIDLSFLHIINSLLCGGGISELYSSDELQVIMAPLQELMARDGFTHQNLFSFFLSRVQANLHIVLSLNTRHPDHRTRLQKCSAVMSKCTVLRVDSWSEKGLLEFLHAKLQEAPKPELEGEVTKNLEHMMLAIHRSVVKSHVPVSSSQFVAFVEEFTTIFAKKTAELTSQMLHLQTGLSKLAVGASQVEQLSHEAAVQEKLLATKQSQAEESLQKIARSMEALSANKAEVEKLKSGLHTEEAQLRAQKESVEDELRKVQPQVDAARKAVGQIKSDHLNEIRSLKIPPEAIRDVLEGVLRLMGNYDTSWLNMKKFLSSRTVKEEIMNFDARKVKKELYLDVQKLINKKSSSFDHATIYHVSVAAAPLAAWVKANLQYAVVLNQIRPLQEHIRELTRPLEASRTRILVCEQDLQGVDLNVAALRSEFSNRTGEAEAVKLNLHKATAKVSSATELLAKLSGEKLRWASQVTELEKEVAQLGFSSLMAAAFVTYLVPASEEYRQTMLSQWQTLFRAGLDIVTPRGVHPKMASRSEPETFSFKRFMSSESEILLWKTAGLPSNEMTIESAIAVKHSKKCRLLVDPLGQAVTWLISCATTQHIPFEIVGQKDTRFTTALQFAVRFGKTLIIQDVDEIEPILYPLLRNDLERQNSKWTVRIGGKTVDFDENFQLYLITRESHINVPPDTLSLLLQANFTVTQPGLEKQLLALTLRRERPDLEEQNNKLIQSEEKFRLQLLDLEKKLLDELSSSRGDILENQVLIDSLNETKIKSTNINKSLKELASLQETLNAKSRVFEPYAKLGASIFNLLQDLVTLNPMYCFGLRLYLQLSERALTMTLKPNLNSLSAETRGPNREEEEASYIHSMCLHLVELMYFHVSQSLYKTDRLTFGMHMALNLPSTEKPTEAELTYFLQHLAGNEMLLDMRVLSTEQAGVPSWIPASRIKAYNYFKTHLPGVVHSLHMQSARTWSAWTSSYACETDFPSMAMNLTSFQRLLVIQALRPERIESAMQLYICAALGLKTFFSPPVVLGNLMSETTASVPVLFITAPGADPSLELEEFAVHKIGHSNYHQLAMGQGQAQEALNLLQDGAKVGSWICLKNLHLVVSWLPQLAQEIHRLTPHHNFRLWLTTEPHVQFPRRLLEATLKITFEPPPGLKCKLQKVYEAWSPREALRSALEERILFLLTILHAVVQERCSYIPQGWTKVYEFSFADLRFGADLLRVVLEEESGPLRPHLPHFRGLLTAVIYGGRVDNKVDKAVLEAYVSKYFAHQVVDSGANYTQVRALLDDTANMTQHLEPSSSGTASTSGSYADYAEVISRIHEMDSLAVLGLPPNIISSLQEKNASTVITQLKAMSTISLTAGEEDQKSHLRVHLSPLLQLCSTAITGALAKVTRSLACKQEVQRKDGLFPIHTFLQVELETAGRILNTVQQVLCVISEALKPGTHHMSQRVLEDCRKLVSGQIPESWSNHWEGPDEPLEYLQSVLHRTSGISKYWDTRLTTGLHVESLDLTTFFNPRAFLSAVCQQAARNLHTTLDQMKLITVWDPSRFCQFSDLTPVTTFLQIQGATFDGQDLAKTQPQTPTLSIVPRCTFAWVHSDTPPLYTSFISVPLYDSLARRKLVTEVQVPCLEEEKQQWLLAGIAFFLPLLINA